MPQAASSDDVPPDMTPGTVVDERVYEVSREKVREYALAAGYGDVADTGAVLAPPTFAACVTLARPGGGLLERLLDRYAGVLHTRQAFTFHAPMAVGDVLHCRTEVSRHAARASMDLLTLVTTCRRDTEVVLEAVTTLALVTTP